MSSVNRNEVALGHFRLAEQNANRHVSFFSYMIQLKNCVFYFFIFGIIIKECLSEKLHYVYLYF